MSYSELDEHSFRTADAPGTDSVGGTDLHRTLSAQEYEQIVIKFNHSAVPYPDKCVHELFED